MKNLFLSSLFLFLFIVPAFSQVNQAEPWRFGHWLSAEEMMQKVDAGKNFVITPPPVGPVRNIAEYDRMQGVLVRYPFGIPLSLVKEMAEEITVTTLVASTSQQATVTSQYQNAGVNLAHCDFLIAPTDSYWTRDYGPWFVSDSSHHIGIVDFPYNRNRPNDDEVPKKVAEMLGIPWYGMNVIHTGGNYMTDGMGISSSTELVWEENPTQTKDSIAATFRAYLGVDPYLVEPDPNGTYIDHIDCWGKFLAPDKILIRKVPPTHPQFDEIEATAAIYASTPCSYGYNYRVFRVNTPNDQPYTNSLILNQKVLVPIMNSSWDDSALSAYRTAMPGYEVIGIAGNPATPWVSTDALHCRNMGIADLNQLYIRHIPLTGNQPAQDHFTLEADLIPCSDSAIYNDSVLIWYKVGNGAYHVIHMTNTSGLNYTGLIPKQPAGSVISYYLYAADKSGHNCTMPYMGPADPFTFTAVYTDITAIPDTLWFETYDDAYYGKTSYLHNYTAAAINMISMDMGGSPSGGTGVWTVNPNPFPTFPSMISPGDSVPVHVVFVVGKGESNLGYFIDTLNWSSELGQHRIILMVNDTLDLSVSTGDRRESQSLFVCNFPNPFSSTTTIGFSLPERSQVRLEILNAFGQRISILAEEEREKGSYQVRFKAGNLPSGLYYYRLVTAKSTVTKKMLICR